MPQDLPPGFQLDNGPAPAAPRAPGVIQGRPKQPDPAEQQRLQLAEQAAANDAARLNIAQQGEQRQQQGFQQGNVSEQQASFLVDRVGGGIEDLRFIFAKVPGSDRAPNAGETILYNQFGPNSIVTRGLTEASRRSIEDTQGDILDALLTLGTGAAYSKEQLNAERAAYFPQFNDEPWQIDLKRRKLERLFNSAIRRAGPLGDETKQALEQYRSALFAGLPAQAEQPTTADQAPLGVKLGADGGNDDVFDRNRYLQERFGINPGEESRLVGFFNANIGNPNVTPEMVAGWYLDSGVAQDETNLPPRADLVRVAEELRAGKNAPATGINTSEAEKAYIQGLDTIIQRAGFQPEDQSATFANTARQGAAFEGFDEIVGIGNAIAEGLQGNDPIGGYRTGRDVTRRMVERGDEANFYTGLAGRVLGGIPTGAVGSAGRVNSLASAARVGAAEGAVVGFNAGDGAQNSLLGAAVGAPAGAALGAGFQAVGNKVSNALRSRRTPVDPAQVDDVIQAGARRDVTVRRPDVDPNVRQQRANVQQTEQGRAAIRAADTDDIAQIETALIRDLDGRAGTIRTEAASTIQTGVKAARDGLRKKARVEYRAAEAQAGNVTAPPTKALAAIDQQLAELTSRGRNLNGKEIAFLQGLKDDLAQGGGLSIEGLRAQRTGLRKKLENAGVYSSDFERRVGLVHKEASKDIQAALGPFPQALARYKEGDKLWAQQAEFGEEVGNLLLGRKGNLAPGQAADRLMGWAKKDPARLNRLLSEADDATKAEVRALVASQLGRQANGDFSLAAFLTQTSGGKGGALSPSAIRSLFGADGQKALADLRILSQAKVDAASATNRSNTGGIVQAGKNGLRRLILGAVGFNAAAEPLTGALVSGATIAGGEFFEKLGRDRALRMLLNPDFTNWLRTLPNSANPDVINRRFAALRSIAARTPAMATDVQAFERYLMGAVNDNSARIAAEPSGADQTGQGQQQPAN